MEEYRPSSNRNKKLRLISYILSKKYIITIPLLLLQMDHPINQIKYSKAGTYSFKFSNLKLDLENNEVKGCFFATS
ncbi:hypothetical protein Belba_1080 [Belliella baltica DSM 15883]|uniref:Uncharacterized protein n=1 Tax=Belliella baltica (strain DSM 15883 / CIP 108006 / LMG 21964 / BA134) TaxID=866536 RepID=I3Z3A0_BELBD|nr:hypothetical protein Belba_1080 [Belliella baltica DSM 15883]